jgi:cytochrome P450
VAAANPLLKNSVAFGRDFFTFMIDNQRRYGDFYDVHLPHVPLFVLSRPEYAKHVLVTNNKKYGKSFAYEFLRHPLGNGLLTSEGDFWLKQRRIAQPAFHRERLANLGHTITSVTQEMLAEWEQDDAGVPRNVSTDLMRLTAQVVARALFGSDLGASSPAIVRCINVINQHITGKVANPFRLPHWFPNEQSRTYQAALQELDRLVYGIIDERRRTAATHHDLLAMLMDTEDADTGERMSNRQVRDEVVTLFIAGTETSAVALSWALHLLATHPEEKEQLYAEVRQTAPDGTSGANPLADLPHTNRVVQETMRLYPPAWIIGREAREDDELDGYFIPRGSQVYVCPYIIHRHPDLWEDPERFRPERFADAEPARHKFAFFPFGGGPRYCIGNHFAQLEMQLVLSQIIRRFDIKPVTNEAVSVEPLITLRPRGGVSLLLEKRSNK